MAIHPDDEEAERHDCRVSAFGISKSKCAFQRTLCIPFSLRSFRLKLDPCWPGGMNLYFADSLERLVKTSDSQKVVLQNTEFDILCG